MRRLFISGTIQGVALSWKLARSGPGFCTDASLLALRLSQELFKRFARKLDAYDAVVGQLAAAVARKLAVCRGYLSTHNVVTSRKISRLAEYIRKVGVKKQG